MCFKPPLEYETNTVKTPNRTKPSRNSPKRHGVENCFNNFRRTVRSDARWLRFEQLEARILFDAGQNSLPGFKDVPQISEYSRFFSLLPLGLDDVPEFGWVWVNESQKIQTVTGVVMASAVAGHDFPALHDSHDHNTHVKYDLGQEGLASVINDPGEIEIEWETGIRTDELTGDGSNPIFPKWVWPSVGDRVWVQGNWIYDTEHPGGLNGDGTQRFKSEIHPPRAFATMREQFTPMPGTGSVPVHITATDLYIHGDGGYATEVLNGGLAMGLAGGHSLRTTPIDDNYDFVINLPPRPSGSAEYVSSITSGPGNTVGVAPKLLPDFINNVVNVHVPLAGTGISPLQVYAWHINVGWTTPPSQLHHIQVSLTQMVLHEDMEIPGNDAELTFSWLNVDKAGSGAWQRLNDFQTSDPNDEGNSLSDFDDTHFLGHGTLNFPNGPMFDMYIAEGESILIRAYGYEQDNLEDLFGRHIPLFYQLDDYLNAYLYGGGDSDEFTKFPEDAELTYLAPQDGYSVGDFRASNPGQQFDMYFHVVDIPLTPAEGNAAPIAHANGAYIVNEGGSIVLSSAGSLDPNGTISAYQWDYNYDGVTFDVNATGSSPTFSAAGLDGPTARVIGLRVIDNLGAVGIAKAYLTVANANPILASLINTSPNGGGASSGQSINIAASFSDTGVLDTHKVLVNWGDGTNSAGIVTETHGSGTVAANHIYYSGGIFTITVTLTDDDGGSSAATSVATITGVGLTPSGQLQIIGTNGRDNIDVRRVDNLLRVYTKFNQPDKRNGWDDEDDEDDENDNSIPDSSHRRYDFNLALVTSIQIVAFDGSDHIEISSRVLIPATIDGGRGNDFIRGGAGNDTIIDMWGNNHIHAGSGNDIVTCGDGNDQIWGESGNDLILSGNGDNELSGGDGNDVLVSADGNDELNGGTGQDILIGGRGSDELVGGGGGDLMIGGRTAFDSNTLALTAILGEWTSTRSYEVRIANLKGIGVGPRANGNNFLKVGPLATVFDDDAVDSLRGGSGRDWFLARRTGLKKDKLIDIAINELVEEV